MNHAVALSNFAKAIPCTLHVPSNAQPMSSQCPAYAQPLPSLCSANAHAAYAQPMPMQPMLSQCPAYAQPKPSANVQPMLSRCPAYAQLHKMPSQCLANASASPANAQQANAQPMPKRASHSQLNWSSLAIRFFFDLN